MPSLFQMMEDTMLMVAANGVGGETLPGPVTFSKPPRPAKGTTISSPETFPIWHWKTNSDPSIFTDVSVISRGMGNARMQVCDKIAFENIKIKPVGHPEIELKLADNFKLQELFLDSGHILRFDPANPNAVGSHFLYPLEAQVDKSILRVFGFDFIGGYSDPPVSIPPDGWLFSDFMPEPGGGKKPTAGQGERVTGFLDVPRVIVFISLICCKERDDFEPGGVLGGGRMIPHIMIMTNHPMEQTSGTVHIQRPNKFTMLEGHNHDHHSSMNNDMHSGLWADSNHTNTPSPFWDDIFDCYELNVTSGTRKMVRPTMGARTLSNVVKDLDSAIYKFTPLPGPLPPIPTPPPTPSYVVRNIDRVEKQGAFDNIHIAPTMKSGEKPAGAPYFLEKVIMAPFCEHDCLHTHWRWGKGWFLFINAVIVPNTPLIGNGTKIQNFGWSKPGPGPEIVPGKPYQEAGAPLIPDNQQLDLETLNSSTFKYHVKAIGASSASPSTAIPAGTYTFINHHGSAYSLSVNTVKFLTAKTAVQAAVTARDEPPLSFSDVLDSNSAHLYWHLRFGGKENLISSDTVMERILLEDASGASTKTRILDD